MPASPSAQAISLTLRSVQAVHAGLRDLGVDWLSPAEQGRLSAMTATRRRAQFIAGHWLARHCLAARAGGHWRDYALSAPDDAAPQILAMPERMASGDWYFSLSHSGDWLACAVALHPVGVDVECSHRRRNFQALNEWIHEPSARPAETTPQEQQARFYAQWTLKEAWIKQVPPSMPRPRMKSVRFAACDAANSVAVVGQNPELTLAVYPATPARLQWEEASLPPLEWTCWNHAADPLP